MSKKVFSILINIFYPIAKTYNQGVAYLAMVVIKLDSSNLLAVPKAYAKVMCINTEIFLTSFYEY